MDTLRPRFSWWMDDGRPGARQKAYQIHVSRDPGFAADQLIWDSGEVESAYSVLVPYGGDTTAGRQIRRRLRH